MTTVHDGQQGYRGLTACAAAGITYRRLDYWARTGLVVPSLRSAAGPPQRLFSVRDIVILSVVRSLLKGECSLHSVRRVVSTVRDLPEIVATTIVSDGATVHVCRTADEAADLLRTRQALTAVRVSDVVAEVEAALATLPAHPARTTRRS